MTDVDLQQANEAAASMPTCRPLFIEPSSKGSAFILQDTPIALGSVGAMAAIQKRQLVTLPEGQYECLLTDRSMWHNGSIGLTFIVYRRIGNAPDGLIGIAAECFGRGVQLCEVELETQLREERMRTQIKLLFKPRSLV